MFEPMAQILVVAEEGLTRRVAWVLEEAGYSTETANTPDAALRSAEETSPKAIVVNGLVPDEEQAAFTQQLRVAAPDAGLLDVSQKIGDVHPTPTADRRLTQPFDADELLGQLQGLLADQTGSGISG